MRMSAATSLVLSVAMLAIGAPLAATAEAAVVQVGPQLNGEFIPADFDNPLNSTATIVNTALPAGEVVASPVNGAVVSWSVIGASGGPFKLRVVQPNADGTYTAVGSSGPAVPAGSGVQTFPTSVPIKAGALIGVDNTNTSDELGIKILPAGTTPSACRLSPKAWRRR